MKGFLKGAFGLTLTMAMPFSFLMGLSLYLHNHTDDLQAKKEAILQKYTLTEEYKEIKEDFQKDYNLGSISTVAFEENTSELSAQLTEDFVANYGGSEIKQQINDINEKIEKKEDIAQKGLIISAVSCILATPLMLKGIDLVPEWGAPKLVVNKETGEDYMDKEVII